MKGDLYALFSTPVMMFNNFISEEERKLLLDEINNIDHYDHGALNNGSKSTHTFNNRLIDRLAFKNSKLQPIKEKINEALNNFSEIWGLGVLELTNSWSNQQTIGSSLKKHCHPDSKVSGALYLNVDDNSSKIFFYHPNPYLEMEDFKFDTEFNWKKYWFQPENCQLILFPSWLQHGSDESINETENRTVVSLNSKFL
jgi:uncharacterized protein (TIGR02466 family)